jgi:hypothetical protein
LNDCFAKTVLKFNKWDYLRKKRIQFKFSNRISSFGEQKHRYVLKARDEHFIGGIFAAKVEAHEARVQEEWVHLRILVASNFQAGRWRMGTGCTRQFGM